MELQKAFLKECADILRFFPIEEPYFSQHAAILDRNGYGFTDAYKTYYRELQEEFNGELDARLFANMDMSRNLETYLRGREAEIAAAASAEEGRGIIRITSRHRESTYLEIDLKHAFIQALEFHNLLNGMTEAEFLDSLSPYKCVAHSRVARLNGLVSIHNISEYLKTLCMGILYRIWESNDPIIVSLKKHNIKPHKTVTDNIIFDISGYESEYQKYVRENATVAGFKVHIRICKTVPLKINIPDFNYVDPAVIKDYGTEVKVSSKCGIAIPQILKLYKGEEIQDDDLYYHRFDRLCKFSRPVEVLTSET